MRTEKPHTPNEMGPVRPQKQMQERDQEAAAILKKIHKAYPGLSKPLWLMAKNLFFRAEHLPEDAIDERRMTLEEGTRWAEKCVALAPNDINCQLHLGVILARWSTNNGIIKSVFNGPAVSAAWAAAIKLKTHYRFPSANTSWGAANYGMGIFNRLVPDSWWFNLFFGFTIFPDYVSGVEMGKRWLDSIACVISD